VSTSLLTGRPDAPAITQQASEPTLAPVYLGLIATFTVGVSIALALIARRCGAGVAFTAGAVGLATPLAVKLALDIVHVTLGAILPRPRQLPELDEPARREHEARTCVVYPVIVHDSSDIDALVDMMCDVRRSNSALLAHVALVDFADSPTEHRDSDEWLRKEIDDRLVAANLHESGPCLSAIYRRRQWNPVARLWMGWERKRGKLAECVDLLLGRETSFLIQYREDWAAYDRMRDARFIITLDAGSRLAAGAADRLVGAMAHPANRAVIRPESGEVVSGFGILRPRHLNTPAQTWFGSVAYRALPPDSRPSIVQRALRLEQFGGQGIIDVAAFDAALRGRIPQNSVLSHDVVEGIYTGSAVVTSAVLFEDNPGDYLAFRRRNHRWVRGDFQNLRWITRRPGVRTLPPRTPARLSLASRWMLIKILLHNLSVIAVPALLALVWLGAPAGYAGAWTLAVLALWTASIVLQPLGAFLDRFPKPELTARVRLADRVTAAGKNLYVELVRWPIWFVLAADNALVTADAAVRGLYRSFVNKRRALEWTSFALAERSTDGNWRRRWREMWLTPAFAAGLGALVFATNRPALPWAAPLLALWFLSPQAAYWSARRRRSASRLHRTATQPRHAAARPGRPAVEQYVRLAVAGFRRHSTYSSAAAAGIVANVVFALIRAAILLAVVSDDRPMAGYGPAAIIGYVWLSQGLYSVVLIWGDSELSQRVQDGNVVVDLSRPSDVQLSLLASDLGRAAYAVPMRLVPPVVIAALIFPFPWPTRPTTWVLFGLSVVLAVVVSFAARFLVNLAAFWLIETRGLATLYGVVAGVMSGVMLPLAFFPTWTRELMWCTPFPAMLQAPVDIFNEQGIAVNLLAYQLSFAVVLLLLGRVLLHRGVRRLVVQGG
jgi:ABC-2 type transport system permease protein